MDPLSVTGSAIAILQLTWELLTATRKYYKSAKSAPSEVAALIDELTTFRTILEQLKTTSQNAEAAKAQQSTANGATNSSQNDIELPMLKTMLENRAPLSICYEEMLAFKVKLTQDQPRIVRSLKWPFQKDEIQSVVNRLRSLRSLLDTAISSDQL